MRRMLVVAPAFPPHPSPAAHRARFMARYAPKFGWQVAVATVRPEDYVERLDRDLEGLVPAGLEITRSGAWSARWMRRLGVGDLGLRSYVPLLRTVRRLCLRRRPDLIFVSGPPFYTALIAAAMRAELGIPYVLDYTDPWTHPLPPEQDRPTKKAYWANRLALLLEPRAVRGASLLLAVSDATHDGVRARHPELPASRFAALPFGFDPADFDVMRGMDVQNPAFTRGDGDLHVAYVGAVAPSMSETIRALFRGALLMKETRPELFARTRFHFVGTSYDPFATEGVVAPIARELGIADRVTEAAARVPYTTALRILSDADAILALGSVDRHYTASKIFNCILAGPPILTLFHEESPVVRFVRETHAGELVTYDDRVRAEERAPQIEAALVRTLTAPGRAERDLGPMRAHSAERMTGSIIAMCDAIVEQGGSAPRAGAPAAVHA